MDYVKAFVQPWNKYHAATLPPVTVGGADYLWLEAVVPSREELREVLDRQSDIWIGACIHTESGKDFDGNNCFVVSSDLRYMTVPQVADLVEMTVESLGGTVLSRRG